MFYENNCKGEVYMNTAQPIRNPEDLENLKKYYVEDRPHCRNQLLIVMGLNTALRISDILSLRWESVYEFRKQEYKTHILLTEQKTGKISRIYINKSIQNALTEYRENMHSNNIPFRRSQFLFRHTSSNVPITRIQAFRIIKEAAEYYQIPGTICCHSLRKTFGYHAWKQGVSPVLLMSIYNHSSFQVTKRYLGIEQDDRDQIFEQIML